MARRAALLFASALTWDAVAQPDNGFRVPKWLSDAGKELFTDVFQAEEVYSPATCEDREKLLREIQAAQKTDQESTQMKAVVLLGMGVCDFRKGEYSSAFKRLSSAISETGAPSEEVLLQQAHIAHLPLMKQAAELLSKHSYTDAALALRRTRVVLERLIKKMLKQIHKQMEQGGQAPPLKLLEGDIDGYGKTGQYLPQILKQMPGGGMKPELQILQLIDGYLDSLDKKMAVTVPALKASRSRLATSGKGTGQLMYVNGLLTDAIASAENLLAAQDFDSKGVKSAFLKEAEGLEKGGTVLKKSQKGSACKEKLEKTCDALFQVADVQSNGFGESRVIVLKAGKSQKLDACNTNANVGIVLASKDGVKLTVGSESQELEKGTPVVVDFCQQATVEHAEGAAVLFAQAWHPEFAAIERTSELRARSQSFGLSEDDVKAVTKVVNDNAKKFFDKGAKLWRTKSSVVAAFKEAQQGEADQKKRDAEAAAEAKRKEDFENDDDRKKGLEELEKKRAAKAQKEKDIEEKRKHREKIREQERAMRDPWLNSKEVKDVEAKIEDLKEQRRDANAKLEFEVSTSLTKDISAMERELKKTIKKARKAHKKAQKGGDAKSADADDKDDKEEAADAGSDSKENEVQELKKQLKELAEKKKAASKAEKYAEAKSLKGQHDEIEAKIKKLEL
eukprot:TRINITY_DN112379_c0_g1_i1.p1 TRINITY_DN112379_c0_g1~~TRINITY_DN112379_c0_g1_i1.p1  ORF type:complete len:678 (-),score=264.86 TRINITY_DN112379_c0_g1_i1:194-2227(-)